jgi:hypothetical protein
VKAGEQEVFSSDMRSCRKRTLQRLLEGQNFATGIVWGIVELPNNKRPRHPLLDNRMSLQRLRWCREGESNPQGTKYRRILSPLRLPVPPSRLSCKCLILRPVYGSVPFSSKMTIVQLCKKVCRFSRISTVHSHVAREALRRRISG